MNRYPLWKYLLVLLVMLVSVFYAVPNLFPETPAIQISATHDPAMINQTLQQSINNQLHVNGIIPTDIVKDKDSLKISFANQDAQSRAKKIVESMLNDKTDL